MWNRPAETFSVILHSLPSLFPPFSEKANVGDLWKSSYVLGEKRCFNYIHLRNSGDRNSPTKHQQFVFIPQADDVIPAPPSRRSVVTSQKNATVTTAHFCINIDRLSFVGFFPNPEKTNGYFEESIMCTLTSHELFKLQQRGRQGEAGREAFFSGYRRNTCREQ